MTEENSQTPKYAGVKVTLAGRCYVVPPLNFRGITEMDSLVREFWALSKLSKENLENPIDMPFATKFLPLVHAAIKRNYPDVTIEQLLDDLDWDDIIDGAFTNALVAAMTRHQKKSEAGEAAAVAS